MVLVVGHHGLAPLSRVKRKFVQRRAMLKYKADVAATFDGPALEAQVAAMFGGTFDELKFAQAVLAWQGDETADAAPLDVAERIAALAAHTARSPSQHLDG